MADRRQRAEEERMRLLYVAMTRAENWLIVAGSGDVGKGDSWYNLVTEAMEHVGAVPLATPVGEGLRFDVGADWNAGDLAKAAPEARVTAAVPGWAREKVPAVPTDKGPLSPSDLGGPKALPGEMIDFDEAAALRRGRRLHLLFEHLPGAAPDGRDTLARTLLAVGEDAATPEEADALLAEARAVIGTQALAGVFAPGALAEVEIAAALPGLGGRRVLGTVDRLIVTPDRVTVIDFKTNALVPATPDEVPDGILRQMGAYAEALALIYPGRAVEAAVLWTTGPVLMPLPSALLTAALGRVTAP
jgi:ATP-dependent helicase/nuclease subunit A